MAAAHDRDENVGGLAPYVVHIGSKADRRNYLIIAGVCAAALGLIALWNAFVHDFLWKEAVSCGAVGLWALYMVVMRVTSQWTVGADGVTWTRRSLLGGSTRHVADGDIDHLTLEPHKALGHEMSTLVFRLRNGKKLEIIGKHGQGEVNAMLLEIRRRLPQIPFR